MNEPGGAAHHAVRDGTLDQLMRVSAAVASAILALTALARADVAPRAVSLRDALSAAGVAPKHQTAVAQRVAADAAVPAAGAWPATTIGVSTTYRTFRLGLGASLPLPIFGTLEANRGVARAEADIASTEVRAVDLELRRDVTKAWVELARAEARAELSERSAKREEELATITQKRVDSGDASKAEAVQANAAARRARAEAGADRTAIAAASADLAAALGWDPDVLLHADGGFPALVDVPGYEQLSLSRAGHPEIRAAKARVAVEAARADEAHALRWPHLALDVETDVADRTNEDKNDYRVGLTLELPLLGHTAAAEQAARAHRAAAQVEHDATLIALDGQIVAAHRRYEAGRQRVKTLEDDVLPAQREAATLARAAYQEGQGGLVTVLEADRSLTDVEREAIEARADAASALADLRWAAGGAL